ncbi:MAG: hypothetical protein GX538_08890 [Gammaproteobacteria bacterium]|nr:hypothetical protein [Gammaproteobacteria bacterium]
MRTCLPVPALLASLLLLAAGCTALPPADSGARAGPAGEAMVAAIRAHGADDEAGLVVQPLRDPRVEDLRVDAARLEAAGDLAGAARMLDEALGIVPDDPALLQERAEVALLQGDFTLAGSLAEMAWSLGARVGPLCQRHQATLEQLRLADGDAAGAAQARERIAACRVTGPMRY